MSVTAPWVSALPSDAPIYSDIVRTLLAAPVEGFTCQDIEAATHREHQSVSANLRRLVLRDIVEPTGCFGVTRSGKRAQKWRVVPSMVA